MASFDSFLSEADRMAQPQGACDGSGTTSTRPDYVSSGDFIGTGPDSAQQDNKVFVVNIVISHSRETTDHVPGTYQGN